MITIKQFITNPDNTYNLVIQYHNRTLRLHSSRPHNEAQKLFSKISNAPIYLIGGLGMGYLLEHILCHSQALCIIYEPNSIIFETILHLRPELQKLLTHPQVIFVQDLDTLSKISQQKKLLNIGFIINRTYQEIFKQEFEHVHHILASSIRTKEVSNATLLRFSKLWIKNIFRNMHYYFHCQKLCHYRHFATNKAAIIVGAGPSLEQALPYLLHYQKYAYIIACDTALPILEQATIQPDFVVSIDPQEQNAFYLRYSQNKNHKLIADIGIHDSAFHGYNNQDIILMDSSFPFYQYFKPFWGECGILASGGSVSTSAFDFAQLIQADPIIMIGQDLAFSQKKTHSSGNILSEFSRTQHHRLFPYHTAQAITTYPTHATKVHGRLPNSTVLSDTRLMLFQEWFCKEIPQSTSKVIIAGMDGAYLQGAIHLPIKEAFSTLSQKIQKEFPHEISHHNIQAYKDFLEEISSVLNNLYPICKNSFLNIKQAQVNQNLNQAISESIKIQKILSSSSNQTITNIISLSIQNSIQKGLEIPEHISDIKRLSIIHDICGDLIQGLSELRKNLKKAQKKAQSL